MKVYKTATMMLLVSVALMAGCTKKATPAEQTAANLKAAIAGEITAMTKYAAYGNKAREEGYAKIALLFRATSMAEGIHSGGEGKALADMGEKMDPVNPDYKVKSTESNLEDALKGETYEVEKMYPDFISAATEARNDDAVTIFNYAMEVEKIHGSLYKDAISALESKDFKNLPDSYYVCRKCGNTVGNSAPDVCPICGQPKTSFNAITEK